MIIKKDFYLHNDVVQIAQDLLGTILYTRIEGEITSGIIVETEAYCGSIDKASHAYPDRLTKRNRVMFKDGGKAYVYLIYGIHYLFNIVTNKSSKADAVLIRALEPRIRIRYDDGKKEKKYTKKDYFRTRYIIKSYGHR